MAWIRLTDNYDEDEQIQVLSDGAFRLWHQGLAWCRRNQTDGLIPFVTMRMFPSYTKGREKQLATPHREGLQPLWVLVAGMGYRIKSYLKWNPSREREDQLRAEARDRMKDLRSENVRANTASTPARTSGEERKGSESLREEDDALAERAGRLREELYPAWYAKYRHGARLRLVANSLEYQDAIGICQTWDDARIEKLARIVLTTDDPFIAGTDRSFKIFALKASWADDRLRQAENRAS